MPVMAHIFSEESCMPKRRILFNFELLRPYNGHVRAILGPCFVPIWTMLSIRTILLLLDAWNGSNFYWRVMHAKEKNTLWYSIILTILGPCSDNIRAMIWLSLQYICLYMPEMAEIFTEVSCMPNRRIQFNVKWLGFLMSGPYLGHFFDNYYNIFALHWSVMHAN